VKQEDIKELHYITKENKIMFDINKLTLGELKEINELFNKKENTLKKEDGRYVIVRTYSAGVFAGNIISRNGQEVVLHNARRLWYWAGAASLSQLAVDGVKNPNECKFPVEVSRVELLEVIEILDTTQIAEESIKSVSVWKQ
jgi:hypothetical protein